MPTSSRVSRLAQSRPAPCAGFGVASKELSRLQATGFTASGSALSVMSSQTYEELFGCLPSCSSHVRAPKI